MFRVVSIFVTSTNVFTKGPRGEFRVADIMAQLDASAVPTFDVLQTSIQRSHGHAIVQIQRDSDTVYPHAMHQPGDLFRENDVIKTRWKIYYSFNFKYIPEQTHYRSITFHFDQSG